MALIPLATVGEVEAAVSTLVEATGAVAAASAGVTSGQTPTTWSGPVTLPSGTGMVTATLTGDTVLTLPDRVDGQAESVNVFVKQAAGGGHSLTFATPVKGAFGVAPILSTPVGAEDWLTLLWRGDGWYVTVNALNLAAV